MSPKGCYYDSSSSNDLHSPSWLPDLSLLHLRNDFEILLIDFPRPAQDMQLFYDLFRVIDL